MKVNRAVSNLDWFIFEHYRIIHGVRIALSFTLAMFLTQYFQLPEASWILISLVVVMVPISYLGNVIQRAFHRMTGTVIGAMSGMVAIILSHYAHWLMFAGCAIAIFASAYYARGKRPYVALLIGITLSVTVGAPGHNLHIATLRAMNVFAGCSLAMVLCLIYPQRAFLHWRLRNGQALKRLATMYHIASSKNVLERPNVSEQQQIILRELSNISSLIAPSARESRLNPQLLDAIMVQMRNTVYTMELLTNSYWEDRRSHYAMISAETLRRCQNATEVAILNLANSVSHASPMETPPEWPLDLVTKEFEQLFAECNAHQEASVYGYLWLNIRLIDDIKQLKKLFVYALNLS